MGPRKDHKKIRKYFKLSKAENQHIEVCGTPLMQGLGGYSTKHQSGSKETLKPVTLASSLEREETD